MKNQSENKTMYTGNGGYDNKNTNNDVNFDLGGFHHINRSVNTVLCFYENIERLNNLLKSDIINNDFYTKILTELNNFTFDKEKFINSLRTFEKPEPEMIETKQSIKKSFDSDDEDNDKSRGNYDLCDNIPTKKYMKRLI